MSTTPSSLAAVSTELSAAREHVQSGRLQEAELAFRRVLAGNPDQPEALRFLANAELARGNPAEAVQLLAHAAETDRNDPGLLIELGAAYSAGDRMDAARYVLERAVILSQEQRPAARLLLANVLERDQRPELALLHYFRAILEAQSAGQWRNDDTTEPGLRRLVLHALEFVASGRRELFERGLQPLRQGAAPGQLERVDRAVSIYLHELDEHPSDLRQKPTFLFVPDLGTGRFIDNTRFAWLQDCAQDIAALGAEADAMSAAANTTPAAGLFSLESLQGATGHEPDVAARARVLPVHQRGPLQESTREHAPQLAVALETAPLVRIPGQGPNTGIVLLQGKARLEMHGGRSNACVMATITLAESSDLEIVVAGESKVLHPGEALVFDPTFGYEYVNGGDALATAVTLEIWHPELSTLERKAIESATLTAMDFDSQLEELA